MIMGSKGVLAATTLIFVPGGGEEMGLSMRVIKGFHSGYDGKLRRTVRTTEGGASMMTVVFMGIIFFVSGFKR